MNDATPEMERLLALQDPAPALTARLEQLLADTLPTREELRRTETIPPELTQLFLHRQAAVRRRHAAAQRSGRLARALAGLPPAFPGTARTC